jgi:hypothetical protein
VCAITCTAISAGILDDAATEITAGCYNRLERERLQLFMGAGEEFLRPGMQGDQAHSAGAESPGTFTQAGGHDSQKAPWKAFFLSLALPGTGELYANAWKRAIVFLTLEAAIWGGYAYFQVKGDDTQSEYIDLATREAGANRSGSDKYFEDIYNYEWSGGFFPDAPWLNDGEEDSYNKRIWDILYEQWLQPWKNGRDSTATAQDTLNLLADYEEMAYDSASTWDWRNTTRWSTYRRKHDRTNELYKKASFTLGLVMVNHVISCIDATKAAGQFNRTIETALRELQNRNVSMDLRTSIHPDNPGITVHLRKRFR